MNEREREAHGMTDSDQLPAHSSGIGRKPTRLKNTITEAHEQ